MIHSLVKLISFQFYRRYSAVRKQFGPPGKDEIPVLEYQMQVSKGKCIFCSKITY